MRAWAIAAAAFGATLSCAGSRPGVRESVPESRDVTVGAGAPAGGAEGYEYVARRPLAVVALAEARGIGGDAARLAVDRLADRLDACVTEHAHGAAPPQGAARIVAEVDGDGSVAGVSLRVDPGAGAASSAVLCLAAPVRSLTFPPSSAANRGLAIEAIWGKLGP